MTAERAADLLDLRHAATDRATIVTVPERRMLAIDGVGAPTGTDYARAIDVLHDVAERLRSHLARTRRLETRLAPIEAAWWTHPEPEVDEVAERFEDRTTWHWQLMIEIPHQAREDDVTAALTSARSEGRGAETHVRAIRFAEGRSAQILHLGGPATERRAVELLYREVAAAGVRPHGHLHEIHLADPRHVSLDRQRVILRLPVEG